MNSNSDDTPDLGVFARDRELRFFQPPEEGEEKKPAKKFGIVSFFKTEQEIKGVVRQASSQR